MIAFDVATKLPAILSPVDLTRLGRNLSTILRLKTSRRVGVSFVSEKEMQRLNKIYRHCNAPTDVLSFEPAIVPTRLPGYQATTHIGDLVVCPSYAKRSASRRGIPFREELIRLLAHGVLHLSGFDHATAKEEKRMFALQERAVEAIMSV